MSENNTTSGFEGDGPGLVGALFGLPVTEAEAELVILPVPWDVTTSYRPGTAAGPEAVLDASCQLDLYDPDVPEAWSRGAFMRPVDAALARRSAALREVAAAQIELQEQGADPDPESLAQVNAGCEAMRAWVQSQCAELLTRGRRVGLLGGDHSTPLGFLQALALHHESFGILQLDAHADLRPGFEGFAQSHASIMHHALKLPQVARLVQVGVRDLCEQEVEVIGASGGRIRCFFDRDLQARGFRGTPWAEIVAEIVSALPESVYISFDIDGLDPSLCPDTGTPVPGGLGFAQVDYLLREVARSGRRIIGFDLCEVAPGDNVWNGVVGARALWLLSVVSFMSRCS